MVFARAQEIAAASPRKDAISVRRVRVSNLMQYNVVVQMRGQSEKTMIVGSHLDTMNNEPLRNFQGAPFIPDVASSPGVPITFNPEAAAILAQARAPGADDDASGVATTLEIFRALSLSPQPLSLTWEFHFYAAEELGLLGSTAVALEWVQTQRRDIAAYLNLDMTAFVSPGSVPAIGLFNTSTDDGLTELAERAAREYVGVRTQRFGFAAGSSDHAAWFKNGIPTVFPFEAAQVDNRNFHTSNDTPDKLNFTHAAEIGRLATAIIIELDGAAGVPPSTATATATVTATALATGLATATAVAGAFETAVATATATAVSGGALPTSDTVIKVAAELPRKVAGMSVLMEAAFAKPGQAPAFYL
ncbi:hypothetical protein HK102_010707 [Quaeritorhiza haematococci]|nr:hypothetical protein HK102_010707 [Quaeritorhiza haematococci]